MSVRLLDSPAEQQPLEQALDCRLLTLVSRLDDLRLPPFELSLHAGALDELEAACLWAERQIIEEGRSLGRS
ncbi:MAG: hypothetical protein JRF33_24250 [Deltaproteobacteria bacterium]|nr:hypothetical protein [Deltaproteobacteria bacterium]